MEGTTVGGHVMERWMEHPLVREAQRQAGKDMSALGLLESLHGVLTELEERFPGVSYSTILDATTSPDPESVRRTMEAAGVPVEQIRLALGNRVEPKPSINVLSEPVMELIRAKVPLRAWVEVYGVEEWRAALLKPLSSPLTEKEQRAAKHLQEGCSEDKAARLSGVGLTAVRSANRKMQYQAWLRRTAAAASVAAMPLLLAACRPL